MIFHILFNYNQYNKVMDEKIQKILKEKIHESMNGINEITTLVNSLEQTKNPNVFGQGIVIGRLYNSFYYQYRRILKRNPTEQEFSEFIQLSVLHNPTKFFLWKEFVDSRTHARVEEGDCNTEDEALFCRAQVNS